MLRRTSPNSSRPDQRSVIPPGAWRPRLTRLRGVAKLLASYAVMALVMMQVGCSFKEPQSTLDPHGFVSRLQIDLFYKTVWVSLFIFVTVGGAMAWAVWRYRERPGDEGKPMPEQGHGNPLIEIGLITGSIALLVIIAIPTLKDIFLTDDLPSDQPYWKTSLLGQWFGKVGEVPEGTDKEPLIITVHGWQWWWSFDYEQFGFKTANEFTIPAGKVVVFKLRSDNVIHSFWLPKIAGKVDLIPGRANQMWMMADDGMAATDGYDHGPVGADTYENGLYYGQCAQYCGESHAFMLFRARVVSEKDFGQWVADSLKKVPAPAADGDWGKFLAAVNPDPKLGKAPDASMLATAVERGAALFNGRATCVKCHTIDPTAASTAPNLSRVASRTSLAAGFLDNLDNDGKSIDPKRQAENFYNWITHPYDYKPGNYMWYGPLDKGGGLADIVADNKAKGTPLTDQDWHDIVAFLMTLK
ncbi:MAG TPA: cytochrome c oxidase subunit II [Opitutales bacterium]|jgi:cytochrome c oxidase subunit 2|nr:cytochrome c oxidase subunit II [Opitutales bacterium]